MGINAEGLGRDHWNEMLAYPRKPIAHWHSLVEVKKSFKEVGEVVLGPWHVCCMATRAGEWQSALCDLACAAPSRGARKRQEGGGEGWGELPDRKPLMLSRLKVTLSPKWKIKTGRKPSQRLPGARPGMLSQSPRANSVLWEKAPRG